MKNLKKLKNFWTLICMSIITIFLCENHEIAIYASELDIVESSLAVDSTQVSPYTIEDGVYFIKNVYSGKYLDVLDQGTSNGTAVIQNEYSGQKSQQFQVQYEDDGYYTLRPLHTNLECAVDLHNSYSANVNGTIAQIWSYRSSFEEQKFIIDHDSRYIGYQIGTKCSGGNKILGVVGSSLDDLALIEIWDMSFYDMNDNWIFEKVNFGAAPDYEEIRTTSSDINCFGFALRTNNAVGYRDLDVIRGATVDTVANATINYFQNNFPTRSIRRVNDYLTPTYPINDNEYRVALRVRNGSGEFSLLWDYHFMIQLNDGSWAHKQGSYNSSTLGYINPSTTTWERSYNSEVIYFAVTY